uniref:DUF7041 domain-containing protein n=1 Tax=Trichogramma kaykai TaxID=54128 RepID=A0ABD2XI19_9HYME
MADGSSTGSDNALPRVPDDSRLHLLRELFGGLSQSDSVESTDTSNSDDISFKELTESIKLLSENVKDLRSSSSSSSSSRGVLSSVKSDNHIDLLSLDIQSGGGGSSQSTRYAPPINSQPTLRDFDPFDVLNLPSHERSASAVNSFACPAPQSGVSASAVRKFSHFPTFWRQTPELWIEEIEEKFSSLGITSDREKFHYTLTSLGGDIVAEVADSTRNLPKENRFEALKNILIRKYVEHPKALMNKFYESLSSPQCNRRPSEFLDALCGTGSSFLNRDAILQFWKLKLPAQIAVHLSAVVNTENEQEAVARADEVYFQLQNNGRVIHKIDTSKTVNFVDSDSNQEAKFQGFVMEIKEAILELSRSISRTNAPNYRQSRRESSGPYCFYHTKYKEKALKCPPDANCKWKEINGADFIYAYKLLIDLFNKQLLRPDNSVFAAGEVINVPSFSLCLLTTDQKYRDLLLDYPMLYDAKQRRPLKEMNVSHAIITDGPPVAERHRLRTRPILDTDMSPAEMLYGNVLRIPGIFCEFDDDDPDTKAFKDTFLKHMINTGPFNVEHHINKKPFYYQDLDTCTHVYKLVFPKKSSMARPYTGPHRVIYKDPERKYFDIDIDGKQYRSTTQHLKPAFVTVNEIPGFENWQPLQAIVDNVERENLIGENYNIRENLDLVQLEEIEIDRVPLEKQRNEENPPAGPSRGDPRRDVSPPVDRSDQKRSSSGSRSNDLYDRGPSIPRNPSPSKSIHELDSVRGPLIGQGLHEPCPPQNTNRDTFPEFLARPPSILDEGEESMVIDDGGNYSIPSDILNYDDDVGNSQPKAPLCSKAQKRKSDEQLEDVTTSKRCK